jgi:hypothetical protein
MKKVLLSLFFSLSFITAILGQVDTTAVSTDSIETPEKKQFIRPGIYIDYGKLAVSFLDFETKYTAGLELVFWEKLVITAEAGQMTLRPQESFQNIDYESTGTYFKAGGGYITEFKPGFSIGLIARYGMSSFSDQGNIQIIDQTGIVGDYARSFSRENLSASWYEVALQSEKRLRLNKDVPESWLNKTFSLGFYLQLRVLLDYDQQQGVDVNNIPGYGRAFDNTIPAFNLFVKINPKF